MSIKAYKGFDKDLCCRGFQKVTKAQADKWLKLQTVKL